MKILKINEVNYTGPRVRIVICYSYIGVAVC